MFPAPVGGWIANRSLAMPNAPGMAPGASLLENWFPTATGVVMRRGSELYATLGDGSQPVTSLFSYKNGAQEQLFGSTATDIYDITTITTADNYTIVDEDDESLATDLDDTFGENSTIGKETVTGQTGGDWVVVQFASSGGVYLVLVNGTDAEQLYDGTNWYPITEDNIYSLNYDAETVAFTVGATLTGGTSGVSAPIIKVIDNGTTGTLWLGTLTDATPQWTLNYDAETAAFTVGQTLTGGTSGATATIDAINTVGTTGTLTLSALVGSFQNNEIITDALTGSATANGTQSAVSPAFQNNETITDSSGGSATADGTQSQIAAGITGIDTSSFSYVWAFKNRLFYVEKNSLNAWYLDVDAIGGVAHKLPLGGVFSRGGSLLFGANWSLDSGSGGSGLSQQCVFITTEGEVAVYQGSDPATADWGLVGVYRIGEPLGKKAHIRAGGDVVIATDIGFVPLSQAVQRDYAALSPNAVSYPIEDEWNNAVALRSGQEWHCEVWPASQMVIIALPTVNEQRAEWFVANARTGAWAPFTGWDANCLEVFNNRCFFGSDDGKVIEANVTGQDQGLPYTASCAPLFEDLGAPSALKIATMGRAVLRAQTAPRDRLSVQKEYEINLPAAPDATVVASGSQWGVAVWGESVWGEVGSLHTYQNWRVIDGVGYALSLGLQVTSGAIPPLDAEIVRFDLAFELADMIT
jgi:hypothetical protein